MPLLGNPWVFLGSEALGGRGDDASTGLGFSSCLCLQLPHSPEWLSMAQNGPERPRMAQNGPEWPSKLRKLRIAQYGSRMAPEWPRMAQNDSRIAQVDPAWPRMAQNGSEWPRGLPKPVTYCFVPGKLFLVRPPRCRLLGHPALAVCRPCETRDLQVSISTGVYYVNSYRFWHFYCILAPRAENCLPKPVTYCFVRCKLFLVRPPRCRLLGHPALGLGL